MKSTGAAECISLPGGVAHKIKDSSDEQSDAESSHYISFLGQESATVVLRVESINPFPKLCIVEKCPKGKEGDKEMQRQA